MEGLSSARIFSRNSEEDLLIEVLAPVVSQDSGFRRILFRASSIDFLYEVDAGISGIALNNGAAIPVALSFAELKKTIYEADFRTGNSIDLSLVTGPAVGEIEKIRLSRDFNPSASADKPSGKSIQIRLCARMSKVDEKFVNIAVDESQIAYFEPHCDRKETETFFQLKDEFNINGRKNFWAKIPLSIYAQRVSIAKNHGTEVLDLTDLTRPKDDRNYKT